MNLPLASRQDKMPPSVSFICLIGLSILTPQEFAYDHPAMGTRVHIVVSDISLATAEAAIRAACAEIDDIEGLLSDYQPDSELSRLPSRSWAATDSRFIPVDRRTGEVFAAAAELERTTKGAFDISAAPLIRLWRESRRVGKLPTLAQIAVARESVGGKHWALAADQAAIRCDHADLRFDAGGIAKGYAAREALRVLRLQGVVSGFVAIGGDIAVGSAPRKADGYLVDIDPWGLERSPTNKPLATLTLSSCGITTSGDAEQSREIGGIRYSHIVDPRTGWALRRSYSVVVIAPDAMLADAYATALSVLGPHEGLPWLAKHAPTADALFLRRRDADLIHGRTVDDLSLGTVNDNQLSTPDGVEVHTSPGFGRRLSKATYLDPRLRTKVEAPAESGSSEAR